MKASIKRRWVEALRSGEYEQTVGKLRRVVSDVDVRFCAMGVLVDLAVKDGATDWGSVSGNGMSDQVRAWSGLESVPAILDTGCPCCQATVIDANDERHMSFAQIADRIEARVPAEDDEPPVEEPPIPDEQEEPTHEPAALVVPVFLDLFAKDVVPDRVPELV